MKTHTSTHVETKGGEYPAAKFSTFESAFAGRVHFSMRGGEDGSTDMTPREARRLAAGLLAAAGEAEQKS